MTPKRQNPLNGHVILLWHRTDLRIEDNPALERAAAVAESQGTTIQPVFVFDPQFYSEASLACDARIEFMHECLRSLREQYRERGSELVLLHGSPAARFASLIEHEETANTRICYTRHPTARYGTKRDDQFETRIRSDTESDTDQCGIDVEAVPEGAIVFDALDRGVNSRDGWSEQCETYLTGKQHPAPNTDVLVSEEESVESDLTITDIEEQYEIASRKHDVPRGGHRPARRRLDWFTRARNMIGTSEMIYR